MFTEQSLRDYPVLVKTFMGIPAEDFWAVVQQVEAKLPAYDQQRLERADRQRTSGAGRPCDQPIAVRVALVLTYLRLHVSQLVVATM